MLMIYIQKQKKILYIIINILSKIPTDTTTLEKYL